MSTFIRLAVVASKICEITRNSEKIRTYSSSRSSKVIDLGANRKRICNFLLVINSNFERIPFSRYWRIKLENSLFSPPQPCLTPPLSGNSSEFLDETYPAKTGGMGYGAIVRWKLHDPNFNRFLTDPSVWRTDGWTDGQMNGRTELR